MTIIADGLVKSGLRVRIDIELLVPEVLHQVFIQ